MGKKESRRLKAEAVPAGFELLHTLRGHKGLINGVAWSPDGRFLVSGSDDKTLKVWDAKTGRGIRTLEGHSDWVDSVAVTAHGRRVVSGSADCMLKVWDVETGKEVRRLEGHSGGILSVAVTADGRRAVSGSDNRTLKVWDLESGREVETLRGHEGEVNSVAVTRDGRRVVSGSDDNTVKVWDLESGERIRELEGHTDPVWSVALAAGGGRIASGSTDATIRIWEIETGRQLEVLEGHGGEVQSVGFSADGRLLASKSGDGTVRLWRCDDWQCVGVLAEPSWYCGWCTELAFHPQEAILATLGENEEREPDRVIRIWKLDYGVLLGAEAVESAVHYTNAKVVLVGETSTGKTCLGRALMGEAYQAQESTHGMTVWNFASETGKRAGGGKITRETMLWDLAGQPDYQVVHQLFLDQTALGIVTFDPTHPENPFAGVGHWEKALNRVAGEDCPRLLVAGRVDRGYPTASKRDIEGLVKTHGFERFIATSAKTGEGVETLRKAIAKGIDWERLPVTTSPQLWKDIREYLLKRRAGRVALATRANLRSAFRRAHKGAEFGEDEFDTVIGHAQTQGLVWRLSFGDYVLMRPELLNSYASAVVRVARKHEEGLGCVRERDVVEAKIEFEDLKRLGDAEKERSLLHAVVELFLDREVALREGEQLVFPSRFNRRRPERPGPPVCEVAYSFEGQVEDVYATLAVRLFYSGAFKLKDLWKSAAEFRCAMGKVCGFLLSSPEEGHGVISVFFGKNTGIEAKVLFLRFINEHLLRRAIGGSVERERIYRCPGCGEEVPDKRAVAARLKNGKKTIRCQYCDKPIVLVDLIEEKFGDPELVRRVREMETAIDKKKESEVGQTTVKAKQEIGEFDVFLAHNSKDKALVEVLAGQLRGRGLNPWLDIEQIAPGRWFQDVIQAVIPKVKSAAVIIGEKGLGRWEALELRTFVSQCIERRMPVIPVLLPGVDKLPKGLLFLKELNWVSFDKRLDEQEALDKLQWGITGERPERKAR